VPTYRDRDLQARVFPEAEITSASPSLTLPNKRDCRESGVRLNLARVLQTRHRSAAGSGFSLHKAKPLYIEMTSYLSFDFVGLFRQKSPSLDVRVADRLCSRYFAKSMEALAAGHHPRGRRDFGDSSSS